MSEQRDSEARGDDPLTCSKCGGPTKENGRWHPDLGAVYGYELGSAERGPAPDTEEARADDEALNSSGPACEARSEPQADSSTYYCTRPAGHSGQHVAADAHEVVFRWPDTPEVAERPEKCPTCGGAPDDPGYDEINAGDQTGRDYCPDPFHTPEDTSRVEEDEPIDLTTPVRTRARLAAWREVEGDIDQPATEERGE